MLQLDYKSGIPIYDQIVNGIIRLKMWGALKPHDALPSVRYLAQKLSVNPNTIQRAYGLLEERGVIYSVAGKGSFISADEDSFVAIKQVAAAQFKKSVQEAEQMGLSREELMLILKEMESAK